MSLLLSRLGLLMLFLFPSAANSGGGRTGSPLKGAGATALPDINLFAFSCNFLYLTYAWTGWRAGPGRECLVGQSRRIARETWMDGWRSLAHLELTRQMSAHEGKSGVPSIGKGWEHLLGMLTLFPGRASGQPLGLGRHGLGGGI